MINITERQYTTDQDAYENQFDFTTLNAEIVVDALNEYVGNNIWEDLIFRFEFGFCRRWISCRADPNGNGEAFIMQDKGGDIVRFYYQEHSRSWSYTVL